MSNNNTRYEQLIAELEQLKKLADEQNHLYKSSRDLLYEGLARVYLWWREANKEEGLLERIYSEYNIQYKKITKHDIQFSPLLRYLWNMDGTVNSNKIDAWNRALNNIHVEFENQKEYYKVNSKDKIISYIDTSGGVTALTGYIDKPSEDNRTPKNKLSKTAQEKLTDAHLQKSKHFFATAATPIANLPTTIHLPAADSGLTLGLLRKTANGYELLSTIDDNDLVNQALVASYKHTSEEMPYTVRFITEIIRTQTLPHQISKLSDRLTEISKYKVGGETRKQYRRLLFISATQQFVLSDNRAGCSVVTIAKPYSEILDAQEDVALAVRDRRFIEANLIYSFDFNFYTADATDKVPAIENEAASHKLMVENTVTKKFQFIRFFPLTTNKSAARFQAVLKPGFEFKPTYTATLDRQWIGNMYALFLSRWVNGYGKNIKRVEHRIMQLGLGNASIIFGFTLRADKFTTFEEVGFDTVLNDVEPQSVQVLSKDIVPILYNLTALEIDGDVLLEADSKMLRFTFKTECADYSINVPCCTTKAKRIGDYFEEHGH